MTTPQKAPSDLDARLKKIRLLSLDVDGVLTDGGLYYADDGSQLRKFNVRDGMGMKQVLAAGIEIALITASDTDAIMKRAQTLGVRHVRMGVGDKRSALTQICEGLGIGLEEVAHMGDDVNDLSVLGVVGLPMTVADGRPEVMAVAEFVSGLVGGDGAVRDVCDRLLKARG